MTDRKSPNELRYMSQQVQETDVIDRIVKILEGCARSAAEGGLSEIEIPLADFKEADVIAACDKVEEYHPMFIRGTCVETDEDTYEQVLTHLQSVKLSWGE